jgi:hypothetical protein
MADDILVDNGGGTDYTVATEELTGGIHLQSVELHTESGGAKTKLAKAEDAAHSSGDLGLMLLAVRKDTAAALAGTDGDYIPLIVDANGRLHVALESALADDAAFTVATSKVLPFGALADETASDSVDEGDVGALRMTLSRLLRVVPTPHTAGGLSTHHLVSAASTNATVIKASPGQVFGWYIYNSNTSARKIAFHDASSTPTAGASIKFAIVIPPTSGANVLFESGIEFATGIAITMVTGLADSDATAVALNDLVSNIFYK